MMSKPMAASLGNALALLVLLVMPVSGQGAENIKDKFLSSNPNSDGWEVGYLRDGDYIAYNTTFDDGRGIAGWALNNAPGPDGDITVNCTDKPIDRYGVHWEPGQVCVHSPIHGDGAFIRYTAPDSADIEVTTRLACQTPDAGVSIEVWVGDTRLIDEMVDGPVDEAGTLAASGARKGKPSVSERSTRARVTRGSKISLIVKSSDEAAPCYVDTFINVSVLSASGSTFARMSLGLDTRSREAKVVAQNTPAATDTSAKEVTR